MILMSSHLMCYEELTPIVYVAFTTTKQSINHPPQIILL